MKKNIAALIVKTIIGIVILSCLIASLIVNLVNQLINGQILEVAIGGVIGVGLAIAYNLLDKETRK